jgi:hypothetical protein
MEKIMLAKHIIPFAFCALIEITTIATFNTQTTHAFSTRAHTDAIYSGSNEKRSIYPPNEMITILISASTNTCAITMNLHSTGEITYQACHTTSHKKLPLMLTRIIFSDTHTAQPLDRIPQEICIKSASFGTTTRIKFQGRESSDISCSTDLRGVKLNTDIQTIQKALHITSSRYPILSTFSI